MSSLKKLIGTVKSASDTIKGIRNPTELLDTLPISGIPEVLRGSTVKFDLNKSDDPLGDFISGLGNSELSPGPKPDMRVRLRPMQFEQVLGGNTRNILSILKQTNGLLFPYTPTIDWSQAVDYSTTSLTHTNQDYQIYKSTPSSTIRVTGTFTAQNTREAEYMMAVMHFLRVVSKMHFGKQSLQPGMPPPVLLLSGYGDYMFNDLPVIIKDHSYSLPSEDHYVDVFVAGTGTARVPVILNISMTLVVQNTPKRLREEFNLEKFRTGELMRDGGWI